MGHPGPDDRFDDLHGEEYNDTKTQDHLKVRKGRFIDFKTIANRWDLNQDDRQDNLRQDGQNQPLMGWQLEDTVPHRAEVQGNDQLDDNEQKEGLCPSMPDVIELVVEEEEKEWNFDDQCKSDKRFDIP